MKSIIFLFVTILIPLVSLDLPSFDKKNLEAGGYGRFEWKDSRWKTAQGREEIILHALMYDFDKKRGCGGGCLPHLNREGVLRVCDAFLFLDNRLCYASDHDHPPRPHDFYLTDETSMNGFYSQINARRFYPGKGADAEYITVCHEPYLITCGAFCTYVDKKFFETFTELNFETQKDLIHKANLYSKGSFGTKGKAKGVEMYHSGCGLENKGMRPRHNRKLCYQYISFGPKLFQRGYLNMDPEGKILYDTDWNDGDNIYYKWAANLEEAITYVALHEYAHGAGLSEGDAEEYARNTIVKIRKRHLGHRVNFVDYFDDFRINNSNFDSKYSYTSTGEHIHAFRAEGEAPPLNNFPDGMLRR